MNQLSGKDLDIAVGLANGWTIKPDELNSGRWILPDGSQGMLVDVYRPSELWMHGGPLIDQMLCDVNHHGEEWSADSGWHVLYGSSALEAVCRLWVKVKEPQ